MFKMFEVLRVIFVTIVEIFLNGVRGSLVSDQRIVCAQVVVDVFKVKLSILTRVLQRQLRSQLEC
jgi:hypothetical protein